MPSTTSQRPTCQFSFAPGGTPPARPYAAPTPAECEPFSPFLLLLDRPPTLHSPLRHLSLPGVSLFRRFCCYLDRPPAPHGALRHPSPPGVSRFRRIGSHLRRVQAPSPALWLPAPDAPLKRRISFVKIRGFKVADYSPRPAPRPWNLRRCVEHPRCVEHRGAHQGRFHSPHRFSEARVHRKGPGAHGMAPLRQQVGTGGGDGQTERQQARTSGNRRASAGRRHLCRAYNKEGRPNGQPS